MKRGSAVVVHVIRPRATVAALIVVLVAMGCSAQAGPAAAPETAQPTATPSPRATGQASPSLPATPTPPPVVATPEPTPEATEAPLGGAAPIGETERAMVVEVVDGDTIKVDRGQGIERVRYIGVDTPETVHPSKPVEFMGKEASAANRALVEGREVVLERDISETDRYGRLLRYVWVEDEASPSGLTFVNAALLAGGLAQVVTYPPDVRWVDLYLEVQREAREQGRGLWADAGSQAEATSAPAEPATGDGDCDPAYPGVCIAPAPPDLDCGDVPFRRFEVLPPDPHRFDGNHDGVGCES